MDESPGMGLTLERSIGPADGPLTPADAASVMRDLGFLVVAGTPGRDSTAYLLVAVRPRPTLEHYDPVAITYWAHLGLHDGPATLDGSSGVHDERFSWGALRVTDRLGVANEFLSFGGSLRAARVDDALVAVFATPGPMVRRGGHSQGWDPGSAHLAAYHARLRACLGRDPRLEAWVSDMGPRARYSAYLASALSGFAETPAVSLDRHADLGHLRAEADRLHREHPDDWITGERLHAVLGGR
jgi:hypothetical protein